MLWWLLLCTLTLCQAWAPATNVSMVKANAWDVSNGFAFYKLASASYCSISSIDSWGGDGTCLPCIASSMTAKYVKGIFVDKTDTQAFVGAFADHDGMIRIVVSFRGTETIENWIEDLKIAKTDRNMSCSGCRVHSGFYDAWASISSQVLSEVRMLRDSYPAAGLYITGHSLGAALATLSAYVMQYDNGLDIAGVYTYGSPRVGNSDFASFFNDESATHVTWRVTHHRDIVVHLPFYHLLNFHHVGTEVFFPDEDSPIFNVCDGSGEDHDCSWNLIGDSISDHLHYFGEVTGAASCAP